MSTITLKSIVKRRTDLLSSEIEKDTMLFDATKGEYFGLNEVGAAIWNAIETPAEVCQICNQLLGQFEVSQADCEVQVLDFIEDMNSKGLLEIE